MPEAKPHKICTTCGEKKPVRAFRVAKDSPCGHQPVCRLCRHAEREAGDSDYDKRIMASRKCQLKKKYGISLEEYQRMWDAQAGLCYLCFKPETRASGPRGTPYLLVVDHNHETGAVRKLLCHNCNVGYGSFKEDPDVLERAAQYKRDYS